MKLPLMLQCPRCGCDDTVRMWTKDVDDADFSLCGCRGNLAFTDDEVCALMEQAREKIATEDGPSDSDLQQYYGEGGEGLSYRAAMIDAGRGHLLR